MADYLKRYTSLPSLFHILQNNEITLLNPRTWEDRNDAFFMAEYRQKSSLKSVLALCFTQSVETYHHWKVFTRGSEGVCIEFDKELLLAAFEGVKNIKSGPVRYRLIKQLKTARPKVKDLPYLKRMPYEDEREYRIVLSEDTSRIEKKSFRIKLGAINRITLNPWLDPDLFQSIKVAIHAIDGCARMPVTQTTLLENEKWKKAVADVV